MIFSLTFVRVGLKGAHVIAMPLGVFWIASHHEHHFPPLKLIDSAPSGCGPLGRPQDGQFSIELGMIG
jgi:hypothetical protein